MNMVTIKKIWEENFEIIATIIAIIVAIIIFSMIVVFKGIIISLVSKSSSFLPDINLVESIKISIGWFLLQ